VDACRRFLEESSNVKLEFEVSLAELDSLLPYVWEWATPRLRRDAVIKGLIAFAVHIVAFLALDHWNWELARLSRFALIDWAALLCGIWYVFRPSRLSRLLGPPGQRILLANDDGSATYQYGDGSKEYCIVPEDEIHVAEHEGFYLMLYGETAVDGRRVLVVPIRAVADLGCTERFLALFTKRNQVCLTLTGAHAAAMRQRMEG
jgi:hypothetical protein